MELENTIGIRDLDSETTRRSEFGRGLRASLPVMVGFVPFALVLGAQAARKGFTPGEVSLLTGMNFGGGSEFAAVHLWTSPPHVALIVAITLLINSRHLLMGAALSPYLRGLPKRKVLPALFLMCDESWAMGLADAKQRAAAKPGEALSLPYYMGASIGLYTTWVCFTFLGAMLGPAIGDIEAYGFDMAFPAVFLVLLKGMWSGVRAARPWLVSLIAGVAACVLLPGAWYVVAGAASGALSAFYWGGEE